MTQPAALAATPTDQPDEATLRARLAQANARQRQLDEAARAKRGVARQAERLLTDATEHAAKLRTAQEDRLRETRASYARSVSEALRYEKPVPAKPGPAAIDGVALTAATEQAAAFQASAAELDAEAAAAEEEAAKHRATVAGLIEDILDAEAHALGAEIVAASELTHRLMDRLAGLALRDDRRPDGPRLHAMQRDLLEQLDRRRAAVKRNPLYLETFNWQQLLADLAAAQEAQWAEYAARLATDADAAFNDAPEAAQ